MLGQRTIAKPPGEHTVSYNIDTYLNMSEKAWAKVSVCLATKLVVYNSGLNRLHSQGIAADAMSHANIPRAKYTYAYLKKNKSANLKTAAMLVSPSSPSCFERI